MIFCSTGITRLCGSARIPASRRGRRRGVTLMECLVACALIAFVLTLGVQALLVCRQIGARAAALTALSAKAQEALARCAAAPYEEILPGTIETDLMIEIAGASVAAGAGETANENGTRIVSRAKVVPAHLTLNAKEIAPNLKEITADLVWKSEKGPLEVRMATRVSRTGDPKR